MIQVHVLQKYRVIQFNANMQSIIKAECELNLTLLNADGQWISL